MTYVRQGKGESTLLRAQINIAFVLPARGGLAAPARSHQSTLTASLGGCKTEQKDYSEWNFMPESGPV